MKVDMLKVLAYVFEHFMLKNIGHNLDENRLLMELERAGFRPDVVYHAFNWLAGLFALKRNRQRFKAPRATSFHVFTPQESAKLDKECQGVLLSLEQVGILQPLLREQVIDRLLHLQSEPITVQDVKIVTLLVLSVHPEQKNKLKVLEKWSLRNRKTGVAH